MKENPLKKSSIIRSITIIILIMGVVIIGIHSFLNPHDRIRATVSNLPPNTQFVSLVSETKDGLQNMDFYPRSELIIPFTVHPSEWIWSRPIHDANSGKIFWSAYVQWRRGDRYGVVTMAGKEIWLLTWFSANDVPITEREFLLSNGAAHFDMSNGNTIVLTNEQRQRLNLRK
jgi:hypothetical protein